VAQIAGAVDPLIGARQRRQRQSRIECLGGDVAAIEPPGEFGKSRRGTVPIVERRLQVRGDAAGGGVAGEIARHDDELPVGAAVPHCC